MIVALFCYCFIRLQQSWESGIFCWIAGSVLCSNLVAWCPSSTLWTRSIQKLCYKSSHWLWTTNAGFVAFVDAQRSWFIFFFLTWLFFFRLRGHTASAEINNKEKNNSKVFNYTHLLVELRFSRLIAASSLKPREQTNAFYALANGFLSPSLLTLTTY